MLQKSGEGSGDWRHYEEYKGMDRGAGLKLSGGKGAKALSAH
jgi:hypothetical protein